MDLHGLVISLSIIIVILSILSIIQNRHIVTSLNVSRETDLKMIKNALGIYYLPESWLKIESQAIAEVHTDANGTVVGAALLQQTFKITACTRADTSNAYVLKYNPNPFANDEVSIAISEIGLLETTKVTSEDQTAQIAALITSAPRNVMQSAAKQFGIRPEDYKIDATRTAIQKFEAVFEVSAAASAKDHSVSWVLPVRVDGKTLDASFEIKTEIDALTRNPGTTVEPLKGIVFRVRTNATITITPLADLTPTTISGVSLFDITSAFVVPLRTSPFVKCVQELSIKNGQLVTHTLSNPSSVKGFLSIPIDLAKAIVSIPAQLISLRIDTIKRGKELEAVHHELNEAIVKRREFEDKNLSKSVELIDAEKKLVKSEANMNQFKINAAEEINRLQQEIRNLQDLQRPENNGG